jgi:molybdopterin molybdotransferase
VSNLISVTEAQEHIINEFKPLPSETIPLEEVLGRVLYTDLYANTDLPSFTNSSMDGYAIRSIDSVTASPDHPISLSITLDIPAGSDPNTAISKGQAARIMTGAVLPEGADTVIPIEDVKLAANHSDYGSSSQAILTHPIKPGEYIRFRGDDLIHGTVFMKAGKEITPGDIGLLASLGIVEVPVYKHPKIAILATGDELIEPNQLLEPGKIRNSNSSILAAIIQKYHGNILDLGIAPDNPEVIYNILHYAAKQSVDLIITTAGVSVGAYDHVRNIIQEHGKVDIWRVNMRPGKPLVFGNFQGVPTIGLPGNPVSAFVGFMVFIVPVLRKLSDLPPFQRRRFFAKLSERVESDGRESYLRGHVGYENGEWNAKLSGHQSSGNLVSLAQANALLIIPSGVKSVPVGSLVEVWPLTEDI